MSNEKHSPIEPSQQPVKDEVISEEKIMMIIETGYNSYFKTVRIIELFKEWHNKLSSPPEPSSKSFLPVLEENYQAQIAGYYNDDKTDIEKGKRNAVIEEYEDLIAIYKKRLSQPSSNQDELTIEDYKEVFEDHKRLVRELDFIINGENAAKQASLCDIVAQLSKEYKGKEQEDADWNALVLEIWGWDKLGNVLKENLKSKYSITRK